MGYGPLEAKIKAASSHYPNIFFHPAVNPQVVLGYTASADIGIALIENTCLSYYYCMPNKLFEYLMVGLPVIVSNMREMAAFVRSNYLGVVTADETPAAISSAIATLLKADLNHLHENALAAGKRYSWELQEQKMIAAYQTFTGSKNS
jgi:glycosyltransferase involved in cell wall biosynthesis